MLNVSQPSHVDSGADLNVDLNVGSDVNLGDIRPSAVVSDAVSSVDSVGDVDYGADSKVDPDFDPVAYINEPRWHTMSLGLDRTRELLARLGNPQDSLRFVHVAGTNGKGSTCACMASILQAAGYKVGLFTSPYIEYFEERIRINGKPISRKELCEVTLLVRDSVEVMSEHPTEFELMTAVAFLYFARQGCDIVVAEVGLGGRLDSTNVIQTPEVALIAPISFDHCALLGNTLTEIAAEKAGIIKPECLVVSAPQEIEAEEVLRQTAQDQQAQIRFVCSDQVKGATEDFTYKTYEHLSVALQGSYQRFNAALALEGCEALRQRGWDISDGALYAGLSQVQWSGRFEVVQMSPDIIIDGAHNVHAARQLVSELEQRYPLRRILFCIGVMADKDYEAMLECYAPLAKAFVCYAPAMDRALSERSLAATAIRALAKLPEEDHGHGCMVLAAHSPLHAVEQVLNLANEHDVICCCGSLYGIAGIKQALSSVCA